MEPAGQLSFPLVVLRKISSYLPAKDLFSCLQTCRYLRKAFNDNSFWQKILPEKYLELKNQEQRLIPAFQWSPELVGSALPPLCDYCVHYLRVVSVINNWNSGRFVLNSTKVNTLGPLFGRLVYQLGKRERGGVFFQDKYFFLSNYVNEFESNGIIVWNLNSGPLIHAFISIKNTMYSNFYVIGNNLVVIECKKVCVYQINLPKNEFPLLYSFIILNPEVMRNQEEDEHGEACNETCYTWLNYNIGQYLVFYREVDEFINNDIHVWDIVNATKIAAIPLPDDKLFVCVESYDRDEWMFRLKHASFGQKNYFFCLYNVAKKSLTVNCLSLDSPGPTVLYNSNLYVTHTFETQNKSNNEETPDESLFNISCSVFSFKTAAQVIKRDFTTNLFVERKSSESPMTNIINGCFILLIANCFLKINAVTLELMDVFHGAFHVASIHSQLNILDSVFIVTWSTQGHLEMWSINKKRKVPIPHKREIMSNWYFNDALTKMVNVSFGPLGKQDVSVVNSW